MISARHWKDRHVFWRALIFWAWLASFIFGFAASDLLHAPNCPEQLVLKSAAHLPGSHLSPTHVSQNSADCLSCLLQLNAQGIVAVVIWLALALIVALICARLHSMHCAANSLFCSARGPPISFI